MFIFAKEKYQLRKTIKKTREMKTGKKTSNPPAFPTSSAVRFQEGMTLRDHFAGLAMQGMVQDSALRELFANKGNFKDVSWMDIMAENSFFIADAMLKQREL